MKNSELKAMLQNAYAVNPTEKENCFVRKYERRHMRFRDVLVLELKYMGIKSVAAGVILCAVLFFFARQGDVRVKWMASSLLPLFALLPSAIVGSSERYGMQELEESILAPIDKDGKNANLGNIKLYYNFAWNDIFPELF